MKIYNLSQGSADWSEWRDSKCGASEAPTMLGINDYKTRKALLTEKATGVKEPISDELQAIFNEGHQAESQALYLIEALIGEELMNLVATHDDYPHIAASFDGITAGLNLIWEHKVLRKNRYGEYSKSSWERFELAQQGKLKEMDMAQVQQQLLVSGAEKCLFTVSDGTVHNMATVEVYPDPDWFERLINGWAQFLEDLETERNGEITDEESEAIAAKWLELYEQEKAIKAEKDALEKQLKAKAQETGAMVVTIGSVKIENIVRKGSIDYSKIPELEDIDCEPYRKPDTRYQKISVLKKTAK